MSTSFGTFFFLMFLSFICTGFILKVKMRKNEIKMQKVSRNQVLLYEAKLQMEEEELDPNANIEQGTPLYKKNARLKKGNFSAAKKNINNSESTAVNSSLNNSEVEDLDK